MALIVIANPSPGTDIRANFDAALAAAVDGDTLIALDGSFPFTGQANTTKRVSIKSFNPAIKSWTPGIGVTITTSVTWYRSEATSDATLDGTAMIQFTCADQTDCGITIDGIHFKSKIPTFTGATTSDPPEPSLDGYSLAADQALRFIKCVNFTVSNCKFSYFGESAVKVKIWDNNARGLFYNVEFFRNAKGWDGLGSGYAVGIYGENLTWVTDPEYGTDNFIFLEDCSFYGHRHSIGGDGNAKYVVRNCVDTENNLSISRVNHSFDTHSGRDEGLGSGNHFGSRAFECYNNIIQHNHFWKIRTDGASDPIIQGLGSAGTSRLIKFGVAVRGGTAMIHNNTISGCQYGVGLYMEEVPFGTPPPYAPGYLGEKLYIWNNTFTRYHLGNDYAGLPDSSLFWNYNNGIYSTLYFTEGTHYELSSPSGYTTYTYPHPRRTDITPPVGTPFRTYKSRTFKSR